MVSEIVMSVLSDNTNRRITIQEAVAQTEEKAKKEPKKRERKASAPKEKKAKAEPKVPASSPSPALTPSAPASAPATGNADTFVGQPCPVCGKGTIIKGKTAYGCSEWRNGCTYRKSLLFCSHHKELDSRFAITLSLSTCIPLFIDVSGMVASVVASMRANGCSHSVSS